MARFTSSPGVTSLGIEDATFEADESGVFEIPEALVPKLLAGGVTLTPVEEAPEAPVEPPKKTSKPAKTAEPSTEPPAA